MGKVGRAHKRYQHKGLRRRAKSLCPFLLQSPHLPRGPAGVDDVSRYGFNGCGNNPSFPIPTRTTHGLGFQRATGYALYVYDLSAAELAQIEGGLLSGWSISSGGDRPTETITLNFTHVEFRN